MTSMLRRVIAAALSLILLGSSVPLDAWAEAARSRPASLPAPAAVVAAPALSAVPSLMAPGLSNLPRPLGGEGVVRGADVLNPLVPAPPPASLAPAALPSASAAASPALAASIAAPLPSLSRPIPSAAAVTPARSAEDSVLGALSRPSLVTPSGLIQAGLEAARELGFADFIERGGFGRGAAGASLSAREPRISKQGSAASEGGDRLEAGATIAALHPILPAQRREEAKGADSQGASTVVLGVPGPGVEARHVEAARKLVEETGVSLFILGSRQTGVRHVDGTPFKATSDLDLGLIGDAQAFMRALAFDFERIPDVSHMPMCFRDSIDEALAEGFLVIAPAASRSVPSGASRRSALFPLALAGAGGAGWASFAAARAAFSAVSAFGIASARSASATAGVGMKALGYVVAAFVSLAALEALLYAYTLWRGRHVTVEDFWRYVDGEVAAGRLDPAVVGSRPGLEVLRLHGGHWSDFTFGYAHAGAAYLRPQLIAVPWLFRLVLGHELRHLKVQRGRAPPARTPLGRVAAAAWEELTLRVGELSSFRAARDAKLPLLQRILSAAQISLHLDRPVDVLAIDPSSESDLKGELDQLSEGRARLETLRLDKGLSAWSRLLAPEASTESAAKAEPAAGVEPAASAEPVQASGRYRAALLERPGRFLPRADSAAGRKDEKRIDAALRRMELLTAEAERRKVDEARKDELLYAAWRGLQNGPLKDVAAAAVADHLYRSLAHRGVGVLRFAADEKGALLFQRLLLHYQGSDGGRFEVSEVELANDGRAVVARKIEPRAALWIKAKVGALKESLTNVSGDAAKESRARELMKAAGLGELLAKAEPYGLEIRHVFGEDDAARLGAGSGGRIYVTVRRDFAKAMRRVVDGDPNAAFEPSEAGFEPQLAQAGPLANVPKAWARGYRGEGTRIFWIDTGLDVHHPYFQDRMDQVVLVDEDGNDYLQHGTHVAGISAADGPNGIVGMAPAALGKMGKVFARDGMGASDGDILAAALEALKWGEPASAADGKPAPGAESPKAVQRSAFGTLRARLEGALAAPAAAAKRLARRAGLAAPEAPSPGADVINLSLGSGGNSSSKLSVAFTRVAEHVNAQGKSVAVFAAEGNAGAARQTVSQPGAGYKVFGVPAFTKGEADGLPHTSLFSSVGWSWDPDLGRYHNAVAAGPVGGNVTSPSSAVPEEQAKEDFYRYGVRSAKSRSGPASPGDSADKMTTTMSGTSQASPGAAGIGALVIQAARRATNGKLRERLLSEAWLLVRGVMMRTARDVGEPGQRQGAGFLDAEAAVRLVEDSSGAKAAGRRKASGPAASSEERETSWDWLDELRAVIDAGMAPYLAAREARDESLTRTVGPEPEKVDKKKLVEALQAAGREKAKILAEEKTKRLPDLLKALDAKSQKVWLVRYQAAFELFNFRLEQSAPALAEAALNDPDARVRRVAFEALAELRSPESAKPLDKGLQDDRWEVQLYAAYALARRGDPRGLPRLIAMLDGKGAAELTSRRISAAFLAGELAAAAGAPAAAVQAARDKLAHAERKDARPSFVGLRARLRAAQAVEDAGLPAYNQVVKALARRVQDAGEVDTVRHVALAALGEMVSGSEASFSGKILTDVLKVAGPTQTVLDRDINRFFALVARKKTLVALARSDEAKKDFLDFIAANRAWVGRGGQMGALVKTIAGLMGVDPDLPTPIPDPRGKGVPGVDGRLGPVQLLVEIPREKATIQRFSFFKDEKGAGTTAVEAEAATAGVDPALIKRHEGRLRATLPDVNGVTLEVPAARRAALVEALTAAGLKVHPARPIHLKIKDTGPLSTMPRVRAAGGTGKGVTIAVVDEGGDVNHPAFKGRVRAVKNFTEDGDVDDVGQETIGHGTHVAGIAAGDAVDGSPYVGMAPEAKIVFAKVLGSRGGTDVQVMEGQAWAASLSADPLKDPIIINESLGGPGEKDSAFNRAVNKLVLAGAMFVAAAGNEGPTKGTVGNPGNAALSFAVASAGKDRKLVDYSSRGTEEEPSVAVMDFGGRAFFGRDNPYEITSANSTRLAKENQDKPTTVWYPDKKTGKPLYQDMSGTSMAAPHAAGKLGVLVGLMLERMLELPLGWQFWLAKFVREHVTKTPQYADYEAGAGLFDNVAEVAKALRESMATPASIKKIRDEARSLDEKAKKDHGNPSGKPGRGPVRVAPFDRVTRLAVVADTPAPESAELQPSKSRAPPAEPARSLSELRDVLSAGPRDAQGKRVTPYVFQTADGQLFHARAAGLEGFLWSKLELERVLGSEVLEKQWLYFFPYLETVLGVYPWSQPARERVRALRASTEPFAVRNKALNDALIDITRGFQEQARRLDAAGWSRGYAAYELFARAANMPGFIAATRGEPRPSAPPVKGRLFKDITDEAQRAIQALGFDATWLMGLFPMDDWGTGGGSPYSISDYDRIHPDLGTDAEYRELVERSHRLGHKAQMDFVPNHTAATHPWVKLHPAWYIHQAVPEGADPAKAPANHFPVLAEDGRWYWIHYGGYLEGDVTPIYWEKTAQLDYSNPEVRRQMIDLAVGFVRRFDVDAFRVDMAYRLLNRNFAASWGVAMPKEEFLEELIREVKAAKPSAAFIAEAYSNWDELSAAGFDLIYNKNDHDKERGEIGWYDALRERRPATLREALRRLAFLLWQRGGAAGQQFGGNHDEWSPERAFGDWMRGAMFLTLLLPGSLLFLASAEIGFDRPEPRDPSEAAKPLPLGVPVTIDWHDGNPDIRRFYSKVAFELRRKLRAELGEAAMFALDFKGSPAVGYALLPGRGAAEGARGYLVVANPNDSDILVEIKRPDLGLDYTGPLPAHGSSVVPFEPSPRGRTWDGLAGPLPAAPDVEG